MSKRSKSRKNDKDDAIQTSTAAPEKLHRPRVERSHISQELRERGMVEEAESVTRHLLPEARCRAMGTKPNHYIHRGWATSERRDIIGLRDE